MCAIQNKNFAHKAIGHVVTFMEVTIASRTVTKIEDTF